MSEPAKSSRATAAAKRSAPAKVSTTAKGSATAKRPGSATKRASAPPATAAAPDRRRAETLPCGVPIPTGVGPDDPIPHGLTHEEEMAFRIARMRAITERAIRTKKGSIELLHRAGLMTKKGEWKKIYR